MATPRTAAAPPRRFDSPEQEAFLGLWRTFECLHALEEELFSRYDLTPQQYNALRLLRAARPETLRTQDLAARLVSRAPTPPACSTNSPSASWSSATARPPTAARSASASRRPGSPSSTPSRSRCASATPGSSAT